VLQGAPQAVPADYPNEAFFISAKAAN